MEGFYPVETNFDATDDVFNVHDITAPDTESNESCLYSGLCDVIFGERYDLNISDVDVNGQDDSNDVTHDTTQSFSPDSQSQVWIDSARGPNVFNNSGALGHITYATLNVYNCEQLIQHSPVQELDLATDTSLYQNDEFEFDDFLAQLPEEIAQEIEDLVTEELKQTDLQKMTVENEVNEETTTIEKDTSKLKLTCSDCGKKLKNQKSYEIHCLGHGNPDLECAQCNKVFTTKFTLRKHQKVHQSKNRRTLTSEDDIIVDNSSTPATSSGDFNQTKLDDIENADSVLAKVMAHKVFTKKSLTCRKYNKKCNVCLKCFDRIRDFITHLIEHVVKSTLAKTPVNENGSLTIKCEICKAQTFSRVDKYKEHLRKHANIISYKCTLCDKSFSDASNYAKHKKTHGLPSFRCDICQRKFHSKKQIAHHMEYHNNNTPKCCSFCGKEFHFRSILKKHIISNHTRERIKFHCRFCKEYFHFSIEKLDHEWRVHKYRKNIFDCSICNSKFRKYADLKKHCLLAHDTEMPPHKLLEKRT